MSRAKETCASSEEIKSGQFKGSDTWALSFRRADAHKARTRARKGEGDWPIATADRRFIGRTVGPTRHAKVSGQKG